MVRSISNGLYVEYAVIIHVMCDLVNTENDTYKSPKIIKIYETAMIFLLRSIFSSGRNFEKIQYHSYFQKQGMKFKRKVFKQGNSSETYIIL